MPENPEIIQDSIPVKAQITITEPIQIKVDTPATEPIQVRVTTTEPDKDQDADTESIKDTILELYKLEYTTAVKRHDDIYKSMWTNFSYMAILAGGILTFGKESLSIEFLVIIACLPLVFWFCGSYLPLDKYGRLASNRASKIEEIINKMYSVDFGKYPLEANEDSTNVGLSLYRDFEGRTDRTQNIVQAKHKNKIEEWVNCLEHKSSVRLSVGISFGLLLIVIIIAFVGWAKGGFQTYKTPKTETTETKLESINNTLGKISNSMSNPKNSNEIGNQKDNANNLDATNKSNTNINPTNQFNTNIPSENSKTGK